MFTYIKKLIYLNRWKMLSYYGIYVVFLWMYVAMFPIFEENAEKMIELIQTMPETLLNIIGMESPDMLSTLEGFISTEYFSMFFPIITIVYAFSLGTYFIAGEIEDGTIEILLSLPISRVKIFFAKYFSGLFTIGVVIATSLLSIIPLASLHKIDVNNEKILTVSFVGILFGVTIYSLATMFSSFFAIKSKASFTSLGIIILMYALHVLSEFKDSFPEQIREHMANTKYFSFFHYADYTKAIVKNEITMETLIVFVASTFAFMAIGLFYFQRRNVST